MATSEVEICNAALDLIGGSVITSLDDATKAARVCKRNYKRARDATLRAYEWNCAMRRASIPAMGTAPDFGFARQFQLPEGPDEPAPYCLRALAHVDEVEREVIWKVEGRRILSDEGAPFQLLYLCRLEDPTQFDALLDDAIAARLAADINYVMTANATLGESLAKYAQAKLIEARRTDAREGIVDRQREVSSWLNSRSGGWTV